MPELGYRPHALFVSQSVALQDRNDSIARLPATARLRRHDAGVARWLR
jgi:hypothetical protein